MLRTKESAQGGGKAAPPFILLRGGSAASFPRAALPRPRTV